MAPALLRASSAKPGVNIVYDLCNPVERTFHFLGFLSLLIVQD